MKNLTRTIYLIAILMAATSCSDNKIKCVLKGEVFNIEYDTLALLKATEDLEWGEKVLIPVIDGKFEHTLTAGVQEVYRLFFLKQLETGSIKNYDFIPVNGVIHFKLYSVKESDKIEIIGGVANKEPLRRYNMYQENFVIAMEPIWGKMDELRKQNLTDTEEYSKLQQELAVLNIRSIDWILDKCFQSLSIYSYYDLSEIIKISENFKGLDIEKIKAITRLFHDKYPEHPYTELTRVMLEAQDKIQVGKKYIDFEVPDLEGNMHKLSEVIKGKYAVIDLWSSWCGSCIMGSRELKPIYEEFKDIGFTICGVAREYRNTEAMASRIKYEKYPWINLVDLDNQNKIWLTYGVHGGGRKFLVDDKGFILAIEPNSGEIREILTGKLALN